MITGSIWLLAWFLPSNLMAIRAGRHATVRDLLLAYNRPSVFLVAFVASFIMQITHPEKGRIFLAHSKMQHGGGSTRRRIVRTFAFGVLWPFATAEEKQLLASWLKKIHGGMELFDEETQLFVLATIAWAVVKCQRLVGAMPEKHLDSVVLAVMSMMNFIHEDKPKSRRIETPSSALELETYIQRQGFVADQIEQMLSTFQGSRLFRFSPLQASLFRQVFQDDSIFPRNGDHTVSIYNALANAFDNLLLLPLRMTQPWFVMFQDTLWSRSNTTQHFIEHNLLSSQSLHPREREYFTEVVNEVFGKNAVATDADSKKKEGFWSVSFVKNTVEAILGPLQCAYYRNKLNACAKEGTIVRHVGIIMDGNRRAAKAKNVRVGAGHALGSSKLQDCVVWCMASGVKNLTVWAFSKDNFQRPPDELQALYGVLREGFIRLANSNSFHAHGMRIHVIGNLDVFPPEVREAMDYSMESTKHNSDFNFVVAVGYGGQDEIAYAARRCQELHQEMTVENIQKHTYHRQLGLPPVDSILRTSGEKRLSGFMLWDCQYAELTFLEENWPDVTESTFYQKILDLSLRKRRFGR